MAVQLNKQTFKSRLQLILDSWNNATQNDDYSSIADSDALLLLAGDPSGEDEPIRKGASFQTWLLGYEFPSTFILFKKDKVTILCSASKGKILSQVSDIGDVPIEILVQGKAKEPGNDTLPRFVELCTSQKRIATLLKERHSGKLIGEWEKLKAEAPNKPEFVDMSLAVSTLMAVKDAEEIKAIQIAAKMTSTLLVHHIAVKLEMILDKEATIAHELFASQIEARLGSGEGDTAKGPDMKVWSKGQGLNNVDWSLTEFCYSPIVQSKSTKPGYDLRFTAESTSENMAHKGVLLVAVGMRYKGYCANVGRSFIVDPTKEQEAIYNLLLSLQSEMASFIKDGVTARDIYQHALEYVRIKNPELEKNFVKGVGFAMGMEFRDSAYLLSPKNGRVIKSDMVLNLSLGFSDLVDENGEKYSLQLADTIKVEGSKSVMLTEGVKSTKDTLFFLNTSTDVKPKKEKAPISKRVNGSPAKNKTVGGKILRNKTRGEDEVMLSTLKKITEHQRELHQKLQEEGLKKYSEEGGGPTGKDSKGWKRFQSYKGEAALPVIEDLRIHVDRKAQTVMLPVHGFAVPFHINTIKNASKSDEGDHTYLRINFQTPGQLAGKKEDTPFEDPDATFIRSVSFRSKDGHRFDTIYKQITELKKEVTKREQQKKEMADVVEQDGLQEMKARRPHKLTEVFVRPALDGKRLPGEVEIHQNGLRYQSPMGSQKIDIVFSNIKHLFFQSCDNELIVIIHLNLKAPIMIGKKKAHDVQFFREASDVQFDETGNRKRKHRYGDEDEIEMEQQERKRRTLLNREFKMFAEKIAEAATSWAGETLEADSPFRELSFEGVPWRTNVRLQPTTDCLVHLTDPPFLVVTLAEIEIASLERVQFSLKQFDLVLIFKDFTKPPMHINSIPSAQLDDVKNWLDSVDIPLSSGPVNLNWNPIMKTINESPYEFFQQGGWSFLGGAAGGDSAGEDSSESESEFEDESEVQSSEGSASGSEFGGSASDVSDDSGSASGGDDSDDGDDWDELERKAAKSDSKHKDPSKKGRADSDDSDDDRRPKKKPAAKANGKAPAKAKGKPAGKR